MKYDDYRENKLGVTANRAIGLLIAGVAVAVFGVSIYSQPTSNPTLSGGAMIAMLALAIIGGMFFWKAEYQNSKLNWKLETERSNRRYNYNGKF